MNRKKLLILVSVLLLLAAIPLPGSVWVFDQAHDTGHIDWSGSVGYEDLYHRDWSYLPPEEGGTLCTEGCWEQVTRLNNGGAVSGNFSWEVSYFEVMLAMERTTTGVGSAVITACSASTTVFLGGGSGIPGFNSYPLAVPAGCRSWSVRATGGFVHFRRAYVEYNGSPPSPPAISGAISCSQWGDNGWCTGNATLDLSASDPQGYALTVTGDLGDGTPIACSGNCSIPLPEGSNTATFQVTAATSGLSASGSTPWKRDSTPPVLASNLSGTSGANGWYVSDVSVSAAGTDLTAGMATLQYDLDGAGWQVYATPLLVSDGMHSMEIQAVDLAGNISAVTQTFNVDTIPPTISFDLPPVDGEAGWYVSPVEVQVDAADAGSGLGVVEGTYDEGNTWQSLPFSVGEGVTPVEVRAFDQAGNQALVDAVLNIDTSPPTSTFLSHTDGQNVSGFAVLVGETADTVSGPRAGEISFDGGVTWASFGVAQNPAEWNVPWDSFQVPKGAYDVLVRTWDEAGNQENPLHLALIVSNPPPDVTLTDWWWVSESGHVTVTPNNIPVQEIRVRVTDHAGELIQRIDFDPAETEHEVIWDGRLANGAQALPGSYPVSARVCDIHDNCSTASGEIRVPILSIFIPPPERPTKTPVIVYTQTATVMPTPTPTMIESPVPTSTPILYDPTPTPVPVIPTAVPEPKPGISLPPLIWPVIVLGGLALLYAFVLVSDPRPAALRALARTIKPTLEK